MTGCFKPQIFNDLLQLDEIIDIRKRWIGITIESTFAGINMFLALLRIIFSPSVARVKMSSKEGQKHIYAQEHQLYYYYNNFKGHILEQKLKISLKSGHLKLFITSAG